jgi:hypothetical protein
MPRDSRSKPSNVVKSRSAPSLLGGFASRRQREELPSNRFIELGDIALGNLHRHGSRVELDSAAAGQTAHEMQDLLAAMEAERRHSVKLAKAGVRKASKAPKVVAAKRVVVVPATRPKLPKPPTVIRPKLNPSPLPPKMERPKPPKVNRPKPVTGRLAKVSGRVPPR